jgi:hypothetical protein
MPARAQSPPRQLMLGQDVLLARFTRHYCDGRFQIPLKSEVVIEGKAVDKKHASAPRNILIPDAVHAVLRAGYRSLNELIDGLESYPIAGLKGMTATTLEGFVPRWEAAQASLAAARDEARGMWAEAVEAWNREFWEKIPNINYERKIGDRLRDILHNLDTKYSVDYELWKAPEPVDVAFGSPVVQKWLKEGRANAEQAVEAALLEFITGPRDALVKAAEEVIATLIDPDTKVIKVGTFTAMKAAMQKLRALREISDVDLIHQIDAMEDRLDDVIGTAESAAGGFTLAIKAKADELVGGINQVIEAARDQDALEDTLAAFGKSGRTIELD